MLLLLRNSLWGIMLGYLTLKSLLLYPPHAIVLRLRGRDSYAVVLIPETADLVGL